MKLYPKNIFQLANPLFFYDYVKSNRYARGIQLRIIEWQDVEALEYLRRHPIKDTAKVFFINENLNNRDSIISELSSIFPFSFFNLSEPRNNGQRDHMYFNSAANLIEKIKARKKQFEETIYSLYGSNEQLPLSYSIPDHLKGVNRFYLFRPSHINFSTINQVLGSDWSSDQNETSSEEIFEESRTALARDKNDLSRLKILIDQMKLIDRFELGVIKRLGLHFPSQHVEFLAPVILVIPFNFPHLGKFLKPFFKARPALRLNLLSLTTEQTLSYINVFSTELDLSDTDKKLLGLFAGQKLSFLDSVAYLHASFKYSPVIRLPQQGNTIKKELSFFQPDTINATKIHKSGKLIRQFGKKLTEKVLPEVIAEDLFHSNRQIVAITDLPIEWLIFKDRYITLLHDVTRIPETPYQGILESYFANNTHELQIPSDILSKTLVILGADDPDFTDHYRYVSALGKTEGFIVERCSTVKQVAEAVQRHSPTFLIFDCHGDYDSKTLSSKLRIGKEMLTGNDIIEKNVSAPIVFLSACHTNPTYGYINSLSQYFFAAGCFAITATYLPVAQLTAGILYVRLLKNLRQAASNAMYENWLHYVSHIIRTSLVTDVLSYAVNKLHKKLGTYPSKFENDFLPVMVKATNMLISYETRSGALDYLKEELLRISPEGKFDIDRLIPEHLFYTNLGRGDLIKFESWKSEYNRINNLGIENQITT